MESTGRDWQKSSGKPLHSYFLGGIPPECSQAEVQAAVESRVGKIAGWVLELKGRGEKNHHSGFGFVHCFSHTSLEAFGAVEDFELRGKRVECKNGWTVEEHKAKTHQDRQRKVYVSCIKKKTKAEAIRDHFRQYGEVKEVVIGKDKLSGRKLGFCVVEFYSEESTSAALAAADHVIQGKRIQCNRLLLKHELYRHSEKSGKTVVGSQFKPLNQSPPKGPPIHGTDQLKHSKKAAAHDQHQTPSGVEKTAFSSQIHHIDEQEFEDDDFYPNSFSQHSTWAEKHVNVRPEGIYLTSSNLQQSLGNPSWEGSGSASNKRSVKGVTTGTKVTARHRFSGHESESPLFSLGARDWPQGFEDAVLDTPPHYAQLRGLPLPSQPRQQFPVAHHHSHLQHHHSAEYGQEGLECDTTKSTERFATQTWCWGGTQTPSGQPRELRMFEPLSLPSKPRPLPMKGTPFGASIQAKSYLSQFAVRPSADGQPKPQFESGTTMSSFQPSSFGSLQHVQGQDRETRQMLKGPAPLPYQS